MFWGQKSNLNVKFESLGSWRIPLKKFHCGFDVYSCYSYMIL